MRFSAPFVVAFLLFSSAASAQEPTCAVERHAGFTDEDAEAVEQVLCPDLARSLPGRNRLRIARLGAKVALTLESADPHGGARPPSQILLSGLEEIPVAMPRLIQAATDGTPIAQTADVTSVVGGETRPLKKKSALVNVWLGTEAVMSTVAPSGGAGFTSTVGLGTESWVFVGDFRLGGSHEVSRVGLGTGLRYVIGTGDVAPYVGIGFGFESVTIKSADGNGAGASLEAGVDFLRTHKFGGAISARLDMPLFTIDSAEPSSGSYAWSSSPTPTKTTHYQAPIVSAGVALRF